MKKITLSELHAIWYMLLSARHQRNQAKTQQAIRVIDPSATRILSRPYEPYDARPMNFLRGAARPAFRRAIQHLEQVCDSSAYAHEDIWGGAFFHVAPDRADSILQAYHADYLRDSIYLFRAE
jgi:hypothetical protein